MAANLASSDLTPKEKEQMLVEVAVTVMSELGYVSNETKLVSTSEEGQSGDEVKGHYNVSTNTNYINDKNNSSTEELITTVGHEITHAMDKQYGVFKAGDADQNEYATNFGEDLSSYTNHALYMNNGGSMATTNTHNSGRITTVDSVFNDNTIAVNNTEFASLDKSNGDDLIFVPVLIGMAMGGGIELGMQAVPQVVNQLNEKGWQPKNIDLDEVNVDWSDVGMMTAIGAVAPSGLSAAKSVFNSSKAVVNLKKQKDAATAVTRINKLDNRIDTHTDEIISNVVTQGMIAGGKIIVKEVDDLIEDEHE